ncbi:hypothetical protein GW17_00022788 [Ensete ventricosum]|nr:hypothetical protein GW17_00022788 [Ensete ventricosum]RZR91926.1 hypothetical protein BHM03_00020125 [Ensete ventricosum]
MTAGEGRSAVKQPAQATGKKLAEEHPAGTEDVKQSAASGRSHPWLVALSTLELPQDHRATVNLAPIAVQPPPFLALESVPRLGEKSCRPSTPEIADSMPGIADRKSDCRPSILEFAAERSLRRNRPREYRPSLPARRSVREEAAVPSADRKHKPKQSRALTQIHLVFHALSRNFKIQAIPNVLALGKSYENGFMKKFTRKVKRKVKFRLVFRAPSQNFEILAILNKLVHGKSYEHGFARKHNGYKHYAKLSFNRIFTHRLEISKQ